jgi:hypothetical protein
LRVFRSVNAVHLPHGVEQERGTTAVWSEKCVARCGSEYDEMRMITTRFVRMLQRCAAPLCTHFLLIFQEVRSASKTCNQLSGCSLPYRGWPLGEPEVPGSQGARRCGGSRAFFLGLLLCATPALIDEARGHTRRHATTGHPRFGSEAQSGLRTIARSGGEPRGQGQRWPLPSNRVPEGRLRREATAKIRPSGGHASTGCDLKVASSTEK